MLWRYGLMNLKYTYTRVNDWCIIVPCVDLFPTIQPLKQSTSYIEWPSGHL